MKRLIFLLLATGATLFALGAARPSRGEIFPAPALDGLTAFGCGAVTVLPLAPHTEFISRASIWAEHSGVRDWGVSLAEHHEKTLAKARKRAEHDCEDWLKRMAVLMKAHPPERPRSKDQGPQPPRAQEAPPWRRSSRGS